MHCVKLLSCLYPKLNYYPFLVISKSIRPLCICENVLSFLIVTGRGSVWLGKGLEGCFYHLLLPFMSLVRLHSYIYTWKKNRKYVRTQVLAFKAERRNWEILQGFVPLPVAELVVLGIGSICPVSLSKHHLDGCHHHLSCMGAHGHPGFGSWWKYFLSEWNAGPSCAGTLGFELSSYLWPWQQSWAVLLVAVVQSLWTGSFSLF